MHVSLALDALLNPLTTVARLAPRKPSLPTLGHVLMEAKDGALSLSATNLEISLTATIAADVAEPGRTTAPADLLPNWLGTQASGQLELKTDAKTGKLHLSLGSAAKATLATFDPEDFPLIATAVAVVSLPARLLGAAIRQVVHAAAADDIRPVLAGVLVRFQGDTLTLAAADGYRLAVMSLSVEASQEGEIIVPAVAMRTLAGLLPKDGEAVVELGWGASGCTFRTGGYTLTARCIEGQFPDYQRIVPAEPGPSMEVQRTELLVAVRAADVFSASNGHVVRLVPGTERLLVRGTGDERDTSTVIPATIAGDPDEVAFNGRHLRDALEALGTERVQLHVSEAGRPGVFRAVGMDNVLHVLMPMWAQKVQP